MGLIDICIIHIPDVIFHPELIHFGNSRQVQFWNKRASWNKCLGIALKRVDKNIKVDGAYSAEEITNRSF